MRNRMSQAVLQAIMYIRSAMRCRADDDDKKKCRCPSFQPSDTMILALQDSSFYDHKDSTATE